MKKGFTLAELLGVIAILGIIALIAVPAVNNSINESNEKLYQTQLKQMIKGAKSYYAEHLDALKDVSSSCNVTNVNDCNGSGCCITLKQLQNEGYLPLDVNNPKNGKAFNPNSVIVVTKDGANFKYQVLEDTLEA